MIDWTRLNVIKAAIGENDFADIMAQFFAEADHILSRLAAGDDPSKLRQDIEFLYGAASSLGFHRFARSCHCEAEICPVEMGQIYQQSRHEFIARIGGLAH